MITIDRNNFDELYQDEIVEIEDLLEMCKNNGINDTTDIKRAYEYAKYMHSGQKRESGQDYIIHPLNVAFILAQMGCDKETIVSGILHDVVEDTEAKIEDIKRSFGDEISTLVDGVTNLTNTYFSSKDAKNTANLEKIFISAQEDIRIIFIKLADRLHNMRTLEYKNNKDKQLSKAIETFDVYAPLAKKLGMYRMCTELEDLSLKYASASKYKEITQEVDEYVQRCKYIIDEMQHNIEELLINENISCIVKTRIRNIYSIFRKKSYTKDFSYDKMHDLIAIKVIIDDVNEKYSAYNAFKCYPVLGLIHSIYKSYNNGGIKDYISNPKYNMYSSIHTTIFGIDGKLVQAQIRTYYMSKIASFGLPAFFGINGVNSKEARQRKVEKDFIDPMREIYELSEEGRFINQFVKDVLSDSIYVYAKDGHVFGLPEKSTAIDFAYRVHTDIGRKMTGAIVNDKPVAPNYVLQKGDRVWILADEDKEPVGPEYLADVQTNKAKENLKKMILKK